MQKCLFILVLVVHINYVFDTTNDLFTYKIELLIKKESPI